MEKNKFLEGLYIPEEEKLLQKPENKYVMARSIEIGCLCNFLLQNGWLKPESLKGPIIDLGTGNGVGMLALRKFTTGYMVGVDYRKRSKYYGYSGNHDISTKEIVELAAGDFKKEYIFDSLRSRPNNSYTLITSFYASLRDWNCSDKYYLSFPNVIKEIGNVLKPGGQFLFTSDQYDFKKPDWAEETVSLIGEEGKNESTLILPVPEWVKKRYGKNVEKLRWDLEPEISDTYCNQIGLIRDRIVHLFTKR